MNFTLGSGKKGEVVGSTNLDFQDECDNSCDITCNSPAQGETGNDGGYENLPR